VARAGPALAARSMGRSMVGYQARTIRPGICALVEPHSKVAPPARQGGVWLRAPVKISEQDLTADARMQHRFDASRAAYTCPPLISRLGHMEGAMTEARRIASKIAKLPALLVGFGRSPHLIGTSLSRLRACQCRNSSLARTTLICWPSPSLAL
jgi:hypothetical protein